jgi:hypothetical protein
MVVLLSEGRIFLAQLMCKANFLIASAPWSV